MTTYQFSKIVLPVAAQYQFPAGFLADFTAPPTLKILASMVFLIPDISATQNQRPPDWGMKTAPGWGRDHRCWWQLIFGSPI
jgi:hypothetical protein